MTRVIKRDGTSVDSSDPSLSAPTRRACDIMKTAMDKIASEHGKAYAQFASIIDVMHTQTDSFIYLLDSTFECSDMSAEDHDYELEAYLELNAVMSFNLAASMGIDSDLALTVAKQIRLAHQRATAVMERDGAELH